MLSIQILNSILFGKFKCDGNYQQDNHSEDNENHNNDNDKLFIKGNKHNNEFQIITLIEFPNSIKVNTKNRTKASELT